MGDANLIGIAVTGNGTDKRTIGAIAAHKKRHAIGKAQFPCYHRAARQDGVALVDQIENRTDDQAHHQGTAQYSALEYGAQGLAPGHDRPDFT